MKKLIINKVIKNPFTGRQKVTVLGLCVALAGSFSCQTEDGIKPIMPDEEVIVFFEEHLPRFSGTRISECFFAGEAEKPWSEDKWTESVVINSMDMFKNIFSCSSDMLPAIDFKFYTLIVGMHQMGGSGCSVDEQTITIGAKKIVLNLKVKRPEYAFAVICPLYYWGIYPKFQNKSISVNIKYE